MSERLPIIRIGLPYSSHGKLAKAAQGLGASTLISAGSLFRRGEFRPIGLAAWRTGSALDSAGFTAMLAGGYRWTVSDYVEFVVTYPTRWGEGDLPFPWCWWSAMDYCVEREIAADRAEVERRIEATVEAYTETLEELLAWRAEGINDVPDPLPVLQGRTADDYLRCAGMLTTAIDRTHDCTCPSNPFGCEAEWHRLRPGLPSLVGLGSVCRRPLRGPDGLLALLAALDRGLPPHVRLHMFGVKGALMGHLAPYLHRIASVDSMAWDLRARKLAKEQGHGNHVEHRAQVMRAWYERQRAALQAAAHPVQLDLFAGGAA
jgi:hypothetical protein